MIRNLPNLAGIFYAASAVIGLPSLVAFCFLAFSAIRLWMLSPKPAPDSPPSGNQAVDLLVTGATLFGKTMGFLGAMGQAIITGLAVLAFFVLLYAVGLYIAGRGLSADRQWARILAILLTLVPFLLSLGVSLSSRRMPVLLFTGACGYLLWKLR